MKMSDKVVNNQPNSENKITKKELKRIFFRWFLAGQVGWNYERMQGLCYCYSIMPVLRKLYKKEEELKKAVKRHLQFFNTEPDMAHFILGANAAIEEREGTDGEEASTAIKTGLMGPFAGVGDTIFGVIIPTVILSIGANMALNGSSVGVWIWLIWAFVRFWFRWKFTEIGYVQGTKLITTMSDRIQSLTEAASILGLTVIGALIPTVVTPKVPFVFQSGEVTLEVQQALDQIMPALIPVILVAFVYWLLGKEKMTSTKAIWILLTASIILGGLGVLGT